MAAPLVGIFAAGLSATARGASAVGGAMRGVAGAGLRGANALRRPAGRMVSRELRNTFFNTENNNQQYNTSVVNNYGGGGAGQGHNPLAASMVMSGIIATQLPDTLRKFVAMINNSVESQRYKSDYDAPIAQEFAELEINRMQRQIMSSQVTSDSTSRLADSLDKFEDAIQPAIDAFTNGINNLKAFLTEQATNLLGYLDEIAKFIPALKQALDAYRKAQAQNQVNSLAGSTISQLFDAQEKRARNATPKMRWPK